MSYSVISFARPGTHCRSNARSARIPSLLIVAAIGAFLLGAPLAFAQGATVQTDREDYAPGEMVLIAGGGFQGGETVTLHVVHADGTPDGGAGHDPWDEIAAADGSIAAGWFVHEDDSAGSTFRLTAAGATSGL